MDYDLNYEKQFLGLLAKQAREEKEWDQEYLADELDIDIRTVRKIESGQGNIAYDLLTEIIHRIVGTRKGSRLLPLGSKQTNHISCCTTAEKQRSN